MTLYRSKAGEVGTREYFERPLTAYWEWAEKQNRYINAHSRSIVHKKEFKKPADAWERYARLIGLEEVGI